MNKHLWQMHLENVQLRRELRQERQRLRQLQTTARCGYCGRPCQPGRHTCTAHQDLAGLDESAAA